VIANNALYCEGGTALDLNGGAPAAMVAGNVAVGAQNAPSGVATGRSAALDLGDPATGQVYPPDGSPLIGAASAAMAPSDDFNGTARSDGAPDVGAYERTTAKNPGWSPTEGFKDAVPVTGPADGGPGDDGPPGLDLGPARDGTGGGGDGAASGDGAAPPADGLGLADGGDGGGNGAGRDGGGGGPGAGGTGGCGCRVGSEAAGAAGDPGALAAGLLVLLLGLLVWRRRR
jgi:hypothetical protein